MTTPTTTPAPAKPATPAKPAPAKPATAKTTATRKPRAPKAQPAPAPEPAPQPKAEPQPKAKTAADYRKEIDLAIITAAGELVKANVPEDLREHVARLIANQLHHLSTKANGWPSDVLPNPDRSEWR